MQTSDFNYELPPELVAQEPLADRSASRMMIVSKGNQSITHGEFRSFDSFVRPGDCLVLNNTRVFPARLHGHRNKTDGAGIEVFLLRALTEDETEWRCLIRPGKRALKGDRILFAPDLSAEILEHGGYGERVIRFVSDSAIADLLEQLGETPLPPYIHRDARTGDKARYQTVYARKRGSAAAPTAGLHFTPEMLDRCRGAGATIAYVTLHVGQGTFAPIRAQDLKDIQLHEEYFEIGEADADLMRQADRRICVGTTSVRTLETAMLRGGLRAMSGETNLFIAPGFHFRATDVMLTNFHLPQSSLLMLVSAFAGYDLTVRAYQHAVEARYRFFSYGDCMLILP